MRSTANDRRLKAAQQKEYVRDLWIVLGSILAFLTVIRFLRLTYRLVRPPAPALPHSQSAKANEGVEPGRNGRSSYRRITNALVSAFRIVAFRLHIPVGPRISARVSELTLIFGYIAVIFVLLFINSAYDGGVGL